MLRCFAPLSMTFRRFMLPLPKDTIYFHILTVITGLIFALGVAANVSVWLRGRVDGAREESAGARLGAFVGRGLSALGHGETWANLLWDVLLQRQLLRESISRWLMHFFLSWGAVELFFIGSLGNMAIDLRLTTLTKDTPWFAFVSDFGGALVLVGALIAAYRRFVLKTPQLRTFWDDGLVVLALAFLVLTGYLLEAGRIALLGAFEGYAFIGYAFSGLMAGIDASAYTYLWWVHVVFSFALVAYVPYSKLFHVFVSPVSILSWRRKGEAALVKGS